MYVSLRGTHSLDKIKFAEFLPYNQVYTFQRQEFRSYFIIQTFEKWLHGQSDQIQNIFSSCTRTRG